MSHQIRNRMGFSCSRRALHQNSVILFNSARDFQLLFVGFLRKQNINAFTTNGCQLLLNGSLSCIFRNINFPAFYNISDGSRDFPCFTYVFNDLFDSLHCSIQTFPQNIAGVTIKQKALFFLPAIRNAIFRVNTFRRELMNKHLKEYWQLISIQRMIVILMEINS